MPQLNGCQLQGVKIIYIAINLKNLLFNKGTELFNHNQSIGLINKLYYHSVISNC